MMASRGGDVVTMASRGGARVVGRGCRRRNRGMEEKSTKSPSSRGLTLNWYEARDRSDVCGMW
jgi:hypothetical protein